ncbi:uncharacterized protein LOC134788860 [Penaeus indicus]|uniref:uncharacterized protein LOC134788860 n=1 Tax=Penaeus indicus TaxID=29960 RepID=UPI00300D4B7F
MASPKVMYKCDSITEKDYISIQCLPEGITSCKVSSTMKGLAVILASLCFLAVSLAVPDRLGGHHNHPPHAHPPPQNGYKLPPPPPQPPTYVPPTKTPPPPVPPIYRSYTTATPSTYRPYTTATPSTYRPYTTAKPPPYTYGPPITTTYRPYTTATPSTYRPYTTAKPLPYTYGPPVTTEKPKYWFDWAVNDHYSGNEYNMQEHRDGEKTEGFYNVLLPDTRVQKVTYTVDGDSGFVAVVTYEGEAKEPTHGHTYLPPTPPTPPSKYGTPRTPPSKYGTPRTPPSSYDLAMLLQPMTYYYILLTNGRLQKVAYTVNGVSGYVAEVGYKGEARYPEYKAAPAYMPVPAYKPAPAYNPVPAYKPASTYA